MENLFKPIKSIKLNHIYVISLIILTITIKAIFSNVYLASLNEVNNSMNDFLQSHQMLNLAILLVASILLLFIMMVIFYLSSLFFSIKSNFKQFTLEAINGFVIFIITDILNIYVIDFNLSVLNFDKYQLIILINTLSYLTYLIFITYVIWKHHRLSIIDSILATITPTILIIGFIYFFSII